MTRLRDARLARGWSQTQLIHALKRHAADGGLAVPARESLRIMVSRWENGHVQPDETYRRYLCAVYHSDERALGLQTSAGLPPTATAWLATPLPSVCTELLSHLDRAFDEYARADNELGAAAVLPVVEPQAALIGALAEHARGGARSEVLARGSRYAEFCGWLRQDAGDLESAQHWSDRALEYAQELDDPRQLSYVLMRKSNLASEAGQPARALGLADAALRPALALTPQLRAVALRQRAMGHALSGEARDCAAALDAARREVDRPAEVDEHASYVTGAYIASEAGLCWLRLREPARAERVLREGLGAWPAELRRDRGLCLTRLATALLDQRQVEEAASVTVAAVKVAQAATSPQLHAQLHQLGRKLAPWRGVDIVSQVSGAIAALPGGGAP